MKKVTAKLGAAVFSAVLLGAISSLPAAAAPPAQGNLHIYKYALTNEEMAGNTGTAGDGTATTPSVGTPLAGITFDVYPVTIGTDGIYPAPGAITPDNYANPTKFTDSTNKEFTIGTAVTPQTTDSAGLALFSALPQGIYLVIEQTSALVEAPSAPFVVAVPMTNPTGDGWLADVYVYPKNETLGFEKTVSAAAVKVGDAITYTLTPQVPSSIADTTAYAISDSLNPALDYVSVGQVVAATTKAGLATGAVLVLDTDYTVDAPTPAAGSPTDVTITFTAPGIAKLATGDGTLPYMYLQMPLNVTVNSGILATGTVSNQAVLSLTNSFGEAKTFMSINPNDSTSTTGTTDIHVATIDITKVDSRNAGTLLANASFKIASSQQNADNGVFLKIDSGVISDSTDPGYTSQTAVDWVVTTDAQGKAYFAGLVDHTGTTDAPSYLTYYLVETQAPSGYNLVPAAIPVAFDASTSSGTNPTFTASVTVANNQGFVLPVTGGAGTTTFMAAGIILLGAGAILLVTRKKRQLAEAK